ncbi:hypothetical protein [Legionella shakespearei]|uniref:SnoaL-like domain-containing protein n=1 Tax=Legionella shakespearei DSM 23087 TaxID=1122169 RepID=A0A0W0YLM8_9GAMM|nr:hypothetical protein [Legionella shakespearei]KTD57817.1 hypothetical protein Lsha_2251 [Legionella shakespearei DSM 23087]
MRRNFFTSENNQEAAAQLVLQWLNETGKRGFECTVEQINDVFADEFQYIVNDELCATHAESLKKRLDVGHTRYESSWIKFPLIESIKFEGGVATAKFEACFKDFAGNTITKTNSISLKFDDKLKVVELCQCFNPPFNHVIVPIESEIDLSQSALLL